MRAPNDALVDGQAPNHDDQTPRSASGMIISYLLERVPEFRELADLREKGWNNPEGDAYFQRQRQSADEASQQTAIFFYKLMQTIGEELNHSTDAFWINQKHRGPPRILDMCMAPGGFLATALRRNPGSHALAFSLPISSGGHKVLLPRNRNVEQRFFDITMLAADMGMTEIPENHPDANNFIMQRQFKPDQRFNLVLCDGQVLRTHTRASYREHREARRLTTTQLVLGLEHIRQGGTIVILLHKIEAWDTASMIWKFSKFSLVRLFKPQKGHAKRSSFYMVANDVNIMCPEAAEAIEYWKTVWRVATFGSDEEYKKLLHDAELSVEEMLEEFGPKLANHGKEMWKVQANALANAPFIRNNKGASRQSL